MNEIYRFQDVALISDKELDRTESGRAWFKDGSVADLEQLAIVNRGIGEIKFKIVPEEIATDAKSETLEFQEGKMIVLQGGDLYFDVQQSNTEITLLELRGTDRFHSTLEVYDLPEGLMVGTPQHSDTMIFGDVYIDGRRVKGDSIAIEGNMVIKARAGATVRIQSKGRGVGRIRLPIEQLNLHSNGSLRLECASINNVEIHINGSSQIDIQSVTNSCNIKINGSGTVNIASGEFPEFKATINGSGTINAAVTVQTAELIQRGSGSISVAHVLEESYEVHGGSGSVTVLKRG